MIQITAVHMVGGTWHEHIAELQWIGAEDRSQSGAVKRETLVDIIDNHGGIAVVANGLGYIGIRTVHPIGRPPYVQTYADRTPTDNLLSLPRY